MTKNKLKAGAADVVHGRNQELILKDEFEGIVLKKSDNGLTVDISALNGVDVTIITDGTVQHKAPTKEQTSAPGVIASSPTDEAFNPANAVINVGLVQLNKISQYLADLPNTAKAEFLVSPKSTATIFGRGLGTWNEDTASVRSLDLSHGIHFNVQALLLNHIFDRTQNSAG